MISGIILASGFSKRMQQEKLLLPVNGITLVERVIQAAQQSLLDEIILVYQNAQVGCIGERSGVKTMLNTSAAEGQSAAIRMGVQAAGITAKAFMFLVGDQPYINSAIINRLISVWGKNKASIIVPVYQGSRGNPVVFPAIYKDALLGLQGDSGGRIIIAQNHDRVVEVIIDDIRAALDIDTAEEYAAVTNKKSTLNGKQ